MRVDHDVCIGAGLCVLAAPGVFDQDDDGLVMVIGSQRPDAGDDAVAQAVRNCPSGALSLQS